MTVGNSESEGNFGEHLILPSHFTDVITCWEKWAWLAQVAEQVPTASKAHAAPGLNPQDFQMGRDKASLVPPSGLTQDTFL